MSDLEALKLQISALSAVNQAYQLTWKAVGALALFANDVKNRDNQPRSLCNLE